MKTIYLIGSLRNELIPTLGNQLRNEGFDVFDDWYSVGPRADDHWKEYSVARGQTYKKALNSYAAQHVYEFDRFHLDRSDIGVMVHPAGKSCHLEVGYMSGQGKPTFIYWPDGEPSDRWDVMVQFTTPVFSYDKLVEGLQYYKKVTTSAVSPGTTISSVMTLEEWVEEDKKLGKILKLRGSR